MGYERLEVHEAVVMIRMWRGRRRVVVVMRIRGNCRMDMVVVIVRMRRDCRMVVVVVMMKRIVGWWR